MPKIFTVTEAVTLLEFLNLDNLSFFNLQTPNIFREGIHDRNSLEKFALLVRNIWLPILMQAKSLPEAINQIETSGLKFDDNTTYNPHYTAALIRHLFEFTDLKSFQKSKPIQIFQKSIHKLLNCDELQKKIKIIMDAESGLKGDIKQGSQLHEHASVELEAYIKFVQDDPIFKEALTFIYCSDENTEKYPASLSFKYCVDIFRKVMATGRASIDILGSAFLLVKPFKDFLDLNYPLEKISSYEYTLKLFLKMHLNNVCNESHLKNYRSISDPILQTNTSPRENKQLSHRKFSNFNLFSKKKTNSNDDTKDDSEIVFKQNPIFLNKLNNPTSSTSTKSDTSLASTSLEKVKLHEEPVTSQTEKNTPPTTLRRSTSAVIFNQQFILKQQEKPEFQSPEKTSSKPNKP